MSEHIQYDFLYDNHFSELKDAELMTERLNLAATAEPYLGKYFSAQFVRTQILKQTDQEIIEEDKQIKKEIAKGIIPDPNAPVDPETGLPMEPSPAAGSDSTNGASGKVPLDGKVPEVDGSTTEPPTAK